MRDVLAMYAAIGRFFNAHPGDELERAVIARFLGFDGNNEGDLMALARQMGARTTEGHGVNSHWPMRAKYAAMLPRWRRFKDTALTREQVVAILDAAKL
ncbi:MAG: YfbU family protein [Polyangiales bacterium]